MPYPYYVIQQAAPAQGDGNSDRAKPNKFTGKDPRKLWPFIMACIMVFNNKPQKFRNDHQHVSYTASFLSEITLLWWQPNLMAYLNHRFGVTGPNLSQNSTNCLENPISPN